MIIKKFKRYLLFIPLLLVTFTAQMPDWVLMKDLEGNRYYMDRQGKIYTSDQPSNFLRTINDKNIEFFINKGIALWKSDHRERGLSLLKSSLCLPVTSQRVYQMQKKASNFVNQVKKREGERYDVINEKAHLLLYQVEKNKTRLVNEITGYRMTLAGVVYVLHKKFRGDHRGYLYTGIRMGCIFDGDTSGFKDTPGSYDVLIGVESERFPARLRSVDELEQHWKRITGDDTFKRTVIVEEDNSIVYSYTDEKGEFAGMERYMFNGRKGAFLRCILPSSEFQAKRDILQEIIMSFTM